MDKGGLDFAVRYPFSEDAKKAIANIQLTERIADLAVERIRKALAGQTGTRIVLHESDKEEDIASFAAARMILGYLRNSFLTSRFAVSEAKAAHAWLDRNSTDVEPVARSFGIVSEARKGRMLLSLPVYLRFSPRSVDYRITNRRLENGVVDITAHEKKRLVEEAVRKHVERIPLVRNPPDVIKAAGEKLLEELPKTRGAEAIQAVMNVEDHPPCVERLLEALRKHDNPPHQARYYLATYLMAIGMKDEAITHIFSDAPDFNKKITTYQVAQIRKKGYSVPSCATVMTYGLCCAVCRIGRPQNWHTLGKERKDVIREQAARTGGKE